jgi:hypothetical protein
MCEPFDPFFDRYDEPDAGEDPPEYEPDEDEFFERAEDYRRHDAD